MKVYYCDACKDVIKGAPNILELPVHLYSRSRDPGYVDNDFNRVSGRVDVFDICNKCNNLINGAAAQTLLNIQRGETDEV